MASRAKGQQVARADWRGRRDNARAFLQAARDLLRLAEEGGIGNPIIVQVIDATIAYGDAVSIRFGGIQNTVDHNALRRTLAHAIGARFPEEQARRLDRILGEKDEAEHGHRSATIAEAIEVMKQAERFAEWAEAELGRP